ncbi:phage holin family protein [Roseibacterium sp. SDUM158017]|uniref:phage holin family protein n=1 Tax=Roseicyclus salinarum TaxID=3036773 RepID=UPI002415630D|nr:phage holin family protein [Roseibacterium sp. SDUM158017]MDG4650059.1 phage holin family protein [Roseibacterium sp. SDUM158017]
MAATTDDGPRKAEGAQTSALGLVGDVFEHVTDLVRKELDLFRAELQENVDKAFAAIGMIVAGVVLMLVALNVLAGAAVAWLAGNGIAPGWAALIVFGALAVIALILLLVGRNNLRFASLAPSRSVRNVRRDAQTLREAAARNG